MNHMPLKYRQAVMAIIVNDKNQFLIGSSPRDGGYKFPQGGIEEGEIPIEAIKREVFEELGYKLNNFEIIKQFDEKVRYDYPNGINDIGNIGQEQTVFKIKYGQHMNLRPQDDEFEALIWVDIDNFDQHNTHHRKDAYLRALELCGIVKGKG